MNKPTPFGGAYAGKRVFVTGHTGFKGSWLCEWLRQLGADVTGYSLPPATKPALFTQLGLAARLDHNLGDVRDRAKLRRAIQQAKPAFVFHLAAQPLVRESYSTPVETFDTNVMGTVNVLDALRDANQPCAAVCITTDKCYENREWLYGYREADPLGGHDPYSASKAAAEVAIASYRRSFFGKHPVRIASARAGNVIGGGDWAADRIVPDCIRSLQTSRAIGVRNPNATRPWQHVLEPLSGYLWLAARLAHPSTFNTQLASAFNFGPNLEANRSVRELVTEILKHWPGKWEDQSNPRAVHEAGLLHLATDKAHALLHWSPAWSFAQAIANTVSWYRQHGKNAASAKARETTLAQITQYVADARSRKIAWAVAAECR